MNPEVEPYVRKNVSWSQLPHSVRQQLGNSSKEYEKCVLVFSIRNQQRFKDNLVCHVKRDEKKYYRDLVDYSQKTLMLFPYHLSDIIIKDIFITPFEYYVGMLAALMAQEKSYDSLPNFTAADCLRLLGIGRNQYIDLVNMSRSSKKFGLFRKSGRELLPQHPPMDKLVICPWWVVQVGYITEEDVKTVLDKAEHCLIDQIIDSGPCPAGQLNYQLVTQLYVKRLIYFDVPIDGNDLVIVPPLEGFVMNRILGDFFETLLYKIFVSIDEHTTIKELANILEIDVQHVQNAVSLYCRLGFARKKNAELDSNDLHPSWCERPGDDSKVEKAQRPRTITVSSDEDDYLLKELNRELCVNDDETDIGEDVLRNKPDKDDGDGLLSTTSTSSVVGHTKKIAFLFDSTLTAYLMMGNLSPGLKRHAVTMFEVGKLSDESLDSLIEELEKVSQVEGEGEAARYFCHALTLKQTISFFRQNEDLKAENNLCIGLDLLRCESLLSLDPSTATRLLNKNYALLVSMAPLVNEIRPTNDCFPTHLGPPIPEISSIWFKLFLYHLIGVGAPSLLLPKGSRPRCLPKVFNECDRLLVTTWGHDPVEIPVSGALAMLLDALQHSPILVQAFCVSGGSIISSGTDALNPNMATVPFPLSKGDADGSEVERSLARHPCVDKLKNVLDIEHSCGFVTAINVNAGSSGKGDPENGNIIPENASLLKQELDGIENAKSAAMTKLTLDLPEMVNTAQSPKNWVLLDVHFGVPLFNADLNRRVCEKIISRGLLKSASLEALSHSSQKLCSKLMEFIAEFQDPPATATTSLSAKVPRKPGSVREIAHPTRPLYFDGGRLQTLECI